MRVESSFKLMTSVMTYALTTARAREHLAREEGAPLREQQSGHTSVLLAEIVALLAPKAGDTVLDATLGMGGHSKALLAAVPGITLIGLDADPAAVAAAQERLAAFKAHTALITGNFRDLAALCERAGVTKIDKAVFDLGWNSTQLASGKGFSFMHDEPLSMSYGEVPASGFSARDILNTWDEPVLADVLYGYGEERYARRIAKALVARRQKKPFATTLEVAEVVRDAVPPLYRHGRTNPATRSFQALRIAVNDELGSIEKGLAAAWELLAPGGRMAVITFHSIEDRLVKRLFAEYARAGGTLLSKKPLVPTKGEIAQNPRARSAKLRGIEKTQ